MLGGSAGCVSHPGRRVLCMDTRRPEPLTLPLPFDDGVDDAVPFMLTAAAHREVLGRAAPALTVVASHGAPAAHQDPHAVSEEAPDPDDPRRLQARALLRSGMPMATVAAALGVDIALVEGWTIDMVDELARRRRAPGRHRDARAPRRPWGTGTLEVPASAAARERLIPGIVFATTAVDAEGLAIVHDRVEPVGMLLDALREAGVLPEGRVRVAVRLAPDVPADRTRAEVAGRLGVDAAAITIGRAGDEARGGIGLRVDVRSSDAARTVRAWCDAEGSGLRGWDSNPQTFRLTADCSAS